LAKKERPDLILCDVMMPELDGYGVIAALRADTETVAIPFIFLTAKGEKPGMNLGADDYLTKPVAKLDLLAAIRSRLERAALAYFIFPFVKNDPMMLGMIMFRCSAATAGRPG
jgi:DNA-binding response OmpR family regulator